MPTPYWAGFMKMLLVYIYLIIFVLILISIVLNKVGMLNTFEDELTVYAYIKTLPHEVFTCPFSKENKELLQCIVDNYNISSWRLKGLLFDKNK